MYKNTLSWFAQPPEIVAAREDAAQITAETLHEQFLGDVYKFVARRVTPREEAEDVTAEVFAAALTAWPRYRGTASPYLYLLGIARRKIVDSQRKRHRSRETLAADLRESDDSLDALIEGLPETASDPQRRLIQAERRAAIRALLDTLKDEQRDALLFRYVDGLSMAETAALLGKSPAAANSLLQRARETLFVRGHAYFLNDEDANPKTENQK